MKQEQIKVSVIIPVYNVQDYINDCLQSVLSQNFDSYEIIIINDGSTDNSGKIIEEKYSNYENVKIFNQPNYGLSSARNLGIEHSKGKYIYFVDSDDYITPETLKILYEVACKNNLEVLNYNAFYFGNGYSGKIREIERIIKSGFSNIGIVEGFSYYKRGLCEGFYNPGVQYYFIKSDFIKSIPLRFEEGIFYEDELFTPKILFSAKRVMWLSDCLYYYRHRNNSIIRSKLSINHLRSSFIIAEGLYKFFYDNNLLDTILKKELYAKYLKIFKIAYYNKELRKRLKDNINKNLVVERMKFLGANHKEKFYTLLLKISPSIYYNYLNIIKPSKMFLNLTKSFIYFLKNTFPKT